MLYKVWDLQSLRDKIPRTCPERNSLIKQIRSVDRTKKIVAYHVFKAQEACDIDHLFPNNDSVSQQIMECLLGISSSQSEFELRRIDAESNILGAIYNVRSLWDQFAYLVHDMLVDHKLPVHKVSIKKVTEALSIRQNDHEYLVDSLQELLESYWYKYIDSFSNTIKHRQLIEMHFNVTNHWDGFRFSAFTYRKLCFDEKSNAEITDGVLEVCNHIINSGNHLNMTYGN